jgi:hypothetical protein
LAVCGSRRQLLQFWVAVAFILERSLERYFPNLTASLNERFPVDRQRRIFVGIAIIAFVYANFRAFDDVQTKLDAIRDQPSESRWPALTVKRSGGTKIEAEIASLSGLRRRVRDGQLL